MQKEDRLSFCINLEVVILEVKIQRSFFGRIHDTIDCFRDLLTFNVHPNPEGHVTVFELIFVLVVHTLLPLGTFINDVPRFLAIFDLPTYLVLLYNVPFWGAIWDLINERSQCENKVELDQFLANGDHICTLEIIYSRVW